jgi:hypothetical protein
MAHAKPAAAGSLLRRVTRRARLSTEERKKEGIFAPSRSSFLLLFAESGAATRVGVLSGFRQGTSIILSILFIDVRYP